MVAHPWPHFPWIGGYSHSGVRLLCIVLMAYLQSPARTEDNFGFRMEMGRIAPASIASVHGFANPFQTPPALPPGSHRYRHT